MTSSVMPSGYWMIAGWTMLHFIWVGVVIGVLAGIGRLALASAGPNARYVLALTCLAALGAAPVIICFVVTETGNSPVDQPYAVVSVWPDDTSDENPAAASGVDGSPPPPQKTVSAPASGLRPQAMLVLGAAACYLPWAWLAGSPLVFLLAATGLVGAERLRSECRILETNHEVNRLCRRARAMLRMSRHVPVGICDRVNSPVLLGILRPVVLLPPAALMGWNIEQLEMVLLHELAHVRRWDNLVNLGQRLIESLLFFHPVVWVVSGWVRREREHCCDEAVLTCTQRPGAYARMLAAMAVPVPGRLALVAMGESGVVTRIRRVLRMEDEAMKLSQRLIGLLMLTFVSAAVFVGASALPTLAAHAPEPVGVPPVSGVGGGTDRSFAPALPTEVPGLQRTPAEPAPAGTGAAPREGAVTLLLLDPEGRPIEGAGIGFRVRWKEGGVSFFLRANEPLELRSQSDGRVRLPAGWSRDRGRCPAGLPVVAMHVRRQLSGLLLLTASETDREITMRLQPPCRVRFRLTSTRLREAGYPLVEAKGHVMSRQYDGSQLFEQVKDQPLGDPYDFEYFLPPGEYRTWAFSDADGRPETEHVAVPFEVHEGQAELDLGTIDLPPTRYSCLYGQPAPELVEATDLRSHIPLSLADLRGQVVLVHFALGEGDPATKKIACQSDVQQLYERYKSQGLQVMVIRSPSGEPAAGDLAGMDPRFIQALDGGGLTPVEGTARSVAGATAALYGVEHGGLTLLVDREGRIVQRIRPERAGTPALVERALGIQP